MSPMHEIQLQLPVFSYLYSIYLSINMQNANMSSGNKNEAEYLLYHYANFNSSGTWKNKI